MKVPTGIPHPTHVDDETGEEWPKRNDPCHPTSSRALVACNIDYGPVDPARCLIEVAALKACPS